MFIFLNESKNKENDFSSLFLTMVMQISFFIFFYQIKQNSLCF